MCLLVLKNRNKKRNQIIMRLLESLKEKKESDLDAPETTLQHREIILRKPFLKQLYIEWYKGFLRLTPSLPTGKILEIGSGGGFLKDLDPDVITSDIMPLPNCDMTFPAENMPFEDNELSAIFMIDVLHHIPDTPAFFAEAQRVLQPGGLLYMIEPANTATSQFIYKNLHHEPFEPDAKNWQFPTSGPLSSANGALPWIVFCRDSERFEQEYPLLQLKSLRLHTPFRYLITGGLSYKSIVPGWSFEVVSFLEKLLTPLFPLTAMFQTIQLTKKQPVK